MSFKFDKIDKVIKCTRCRNVHSESDRFWIKGKDGWDHSCCPKCEGRITTELLLSEYEAEVEKQKRHYPALKNEQIRADWVGAAFALGTSPIDFLNNVISDCF